MRHYVELRGTKGDADAGARIGVPAARHVWRDQYQEDDRVSVGAFSPLFHFPCFPRSLARSCRRRYPILISRYFILQHLARHQGPLA